MSRALGGQFLIVAFHSLPAFVWSVIAWDLWWYVRTHRPTSGLFRVARFVAVFMALHFILHVLISMTPTELGGRLKGFHFVSEAVIGFMVVGSVAVFRHMVFLLPIREEKPTRAWLIGHYGGSALYCAVVFLVQLVRGQWDLWGPAGGGYMLVVGGLSLNQMRRLARQGAWSPGGLEIRRSDLSVAVIGAVIGGALVMLAAAGGMVGAMGGGVIGETDDVVGDLVALTLHTAFGLSFALPFAMRMLGRMVRVSMLASVTLTHAALFYLALIPISRIDDAELRRLLQVGAVLLLALMLAGHRAWMEAVFRRKVSLFSGLGRFIGPWNDLVDRLVFGRSPRGELQAFLATLSPELRLAECSARAVAEVARAMQLRGAAILLPRENVAVHEGEVRIGPLRGAWPRLPRDLLPARAYAGAELRELPLVVKEALIDADVVGVLPITSPRRAWGHLFISTGFLETATEDENVETLQIFADQLALVLDSSELLSRAIAVERSLAHAEKLAAIGELAARVAHEIRNPITAARSLAQQLAREPGAPFGEEHDLILKELERVERQVAALLRFARREDLEVEPVDLGALVRATADEFRARLATHAIGLGVEAPDAVVAPVDREKIRQVLVNLLDNAVDALAAAAPPRELRLGVSASNGTAHVEVRDSGPGAGDDDLPRLFEPFFSRKSHGTGLGLAIAKRTVEAHGGSIAAERDPAGGMCFHLELPLAHAARADTHRGAP